MDLTTYQRVSNLVAPGETSPAAFQTVVGQLITAVSAAVEQYLGRSAETTSRVQYLNVDGGSRIFQLQAFPVTTLASVYFDTDQVFGASTLLTSSDYFDPTLSSSGLLVFKYSLSASVGFAPSALKVTYTGGMAASAAAFITAFPDIAHAVDLQVSHLYHTRNMIGTVSSSGDSGAVGLVPADWLPEVKTVLDRHRVRHI